jgi:hypothetical protein
MYPVKSYHLDVDFALIYGESFAHLTKQKPASVFLVEGSEIAVLNSQHPATRD